MDIRTILSRIQKHKGFVYGEAKLLKEKRETLLEVSIRPRKGRRAACSGCGRKAAGYDVLAPRRFEFIPFWGIAGCARVCDAPGAERSALIEFVCSDMWQPYLTVIAERIAQAVHILDRFHIMMHLSKAIDQVRAAEAREMKRNGLEPVLT